MKHRAGALASVVLGVLIESAAHAASAAAQGGGRVERLGENAADLFSDVLGPLIIVLVAATGVYAFVKREIGIAVTAAAIAVFLGLFVFAPESAESLIKGFWEQIA